ncbi:protein SPIRAL1-like 3 [Impatiens glandulifera]|uniref:protein SPIRAL1-like 3 n=1 Tax=Impatiens glandulifera TaxID=253017 RepID=UPI001FB12C63|nr:protein SPIRAL1-like 3 [Impatiens glandulifera]
MGRGVSCGGGQSSLGYLFGNGEVPPPQQPTVNNEPPASPEEPAVNKQVPSDPQNGGDAIKQIPAGVNSSAKNNYFRAEGQNCGNFLTDRPTTKVHAAPGGGSSLDYLFGGAGGSKNSGGGN